MSMEFRILGPLEVRRDGRQLVLEGPKQRSLLASLLTRANRVVSSAQLMEDLWGEAAPATARKTLQTYVQRLRRVLRGGQDTSDERHVVVTRPNGYMLTIGPDELDLYRFEELVTGARQALAHGAPDSAAPALRAALSVWRGSALDDVESESLKLTVVPRLEQDRMAALEDRIETDLRLGRHAELIGELKELVAVHPFREVYCGQLMVALYRSGRQTEALAYYRDTRRALVGEQGIEPGRVLQNLHAAILDADPVLESRSAPPPASLLHSTMARARPWRLRSDLAGFTGQDGLRRGFGGCSFPKARDNRRPSP